MTSLPERIQYAIQLGKMLQNNVALSELIARSDKHNPWFIPAFAQAAVEAVVNKMLDKENLQTWISRYPTAPTFSTTKTLALVMAGNIPLVGFHDFLCGYVAGYQLKIKLSSKDDLLFPHFLQTLKSIDGNTSEQIEIVEKLTNFDKVIATGSDNTNRYFEYYFRNCPRLLRKNKQSVAVLQGSESRLELQLLGDDILQYFGFGCRNVAKIYVPDGYDITQLFPAFEKYKWLHNHPKYMNNYDYNRTVLLLNNTPHYANEFLMIEQHESIASPIAQLYYETYESLSALLEKLELHRERIQCVAANFQLPTWNTVALGQTQQPNLWDYADGEDTMRFLLAG